MNCGKKLLLGMVLPGCLTLLGHINLAHGFALTGNEWSQDTASFNVDFQFSDNGFSANDFELGFIEALQKWNNKSNFTFAYVQNVNSDPCNSSNSPDFFNGIRFQGTFCGQSWGSSTLAVTRTWFNNSNQYLDADIVFNSNKNWGIHNSNSKIPTKIGKITNTLFFNIFTLP